jgi:hypothetical protein
MTEQCAAAQLPTYRLVAVNTRVAGVMEALGERIDELADALAETIIGRGGGLD